MKYRMLKKDEKVRKGDEYCAMFRGKAQWYKSSNWRPGPTGDGKQQRGFQYRRPIRTKSPARKTKLTFDQWWKRNSGREFVTCRDCIEAVWKAAQQNA